MCGIVLLIPVFMFHGEYREKQGHLAGRVLQESITYQALKSGRKVKIKDIIVPPLFVPDKRNTAPVCEGCHAPQPIKWIIDPDKAVGYGFR
jgi:hypothetical protein